MGIAASNENRYFFETKDSQKRLDGCGHWHSVKVSGVSTTNVIRFEPELNDDSVVIDYGLSTEFSVDANDWVWTTDATNDSAAFNGIVFSNNSCSASCYQGPYDSFFSS